jgi:predicted nucleotidyltransferase
MKAALSSLRVPLPMTQIGSFCRRWSIARLEVFGSALRDDFRPDSDVDLLATYAPEARWSLLDRVRMKLELEAILGRDVDLLNRRALEKARTHSRAAAILAQTEPLYVE